MDVPYATDDDILDLGYIPEADFAKINAARPTRIPKLILAWSSHADTYLRLTNEVPLKAPYPACVTMHVARLVVYDLYITRGFKATDAKVAEAIENGKKAADEWFIALAKRAARLDPNADQTPDVDELEPSYGSGYDPANPNADLYGDLGKPCGAC